MRPAIDEIALRLADAFRTARPIDPSELGFDAADSSCGYAVQDRLVEAFQITGRRQIGWKIGLTSAKALALFGADEPMVGRIYADSRIDDGGMLDLSRCCAPRVEGELLIEIDHLPDADADDAAVVAGIRSVRPAIEIADSRIAGWPRAVGHAIADNACCGRILFPPSGFPADQIDFAAIGMTMVEDGTLVTEGRGSDCMGTILNVYRWFADRARRAGWEVKAGDLLLTGAMGRAVEPSPGRTYQVWLESLGQVSLRTGAGS
ncbi:MAG: 2-keto-4-pentenoate hydratase [Pseudomonadota bacterium]